MKAMLVEWLDAESIDDWTPAPEVDHTVASVFTLGWLISETFETLTLALNHDKKNEAYSCIIKIPKGMIVQRKLINVGVKNVGKHPRRRRL